MSIEPQTVNPTRFVPLHKLALDAPNWQNPRQFTALDRLGLQRFGERLVADGVKTPLRVQRVIVHGDIVNLVTDGQRRKKGLDLVADPEMLVPVVDVIGEDELELTEAVADLLIDDALATMDREDISSYELVEVGAHLRARGKTNEQIGARLRRSPTWVSKMLGAWKTATDALKAKFRKGEVTDEMFKDLAAVTDPVAQGNAIQRVAEARDVGDKTEARMRAKEVKEAAKPTGGLKPTAGEAKIGAAAPFKAPTVQEDMFKPAPPPEPKEKLVNRAVVEDLFATIGKRTPSHDYVRGIQDALAFVMGRITPDDFRRPWAQFVARLDGAPVAKKAKAKPTRAKAPKAKDKAKAKRVKK